MHSLDLSELKSQPPSRQVLVDESGCVQEKIEAECSGSTGHKEAWLGLEGQGKSDGGWGALRRPQPRPSVRAEQWGQGWEKKAGGRQRRGWETGSAPTGPPLWEVEAPLPQGPLLSL